LPHLTYRRPLEREAELLATAPDLPLERFDLFAVDGEVMMKRTEATRFGLKPSLRPISSAEGTGFLTTYVIIDLLYAPFEFEKTLGNLPTFEPRGNKRC
jgi:hypothetical protein